MARAVRIGNAHGFWGDRIDAAAEMLAAEPDLDYITLDFLAEVSMSILAQQRQRDPDAGFARDFVDVVESLAGHWKSGSKCRVITNAGGLNPMGCATACQQALNAAGCTDLVIAVVSSDDVLEVMQAHVADAVNNDKSRNLDTNESITTVTDRLITANAYFGAKPIVDALAQQADLVITGRVADPSLTVAPCVHHFGWDWNDHDRLAGATVAGHLIECGTQVTGGISTDWLDVPDVERIGFPIVEVADDGSCLVTKPRGSGGLVSDLTVREQLVYEIGDPAAYLSPDVTASFLSLQVDQQAPNRVRVSGATGGAPPDSYKVSATYHDGFRAAGQLTIYGFDAVAKARRAAESVLQHSSPCPHGFRDMLVECLGTGVCHPNVGQVSNLPDSNVATNQISPETAHTEIVLRIAVEDASRLSVERFSRELMSLITAGPPGTTGYAEGRPRIHPVIRYWPCLIDRERVQPDVRILDKASVDDQWSVKAGEPRIWDGEAAAEPRSTRPAARQEPRPPKHATPVMIADPNEPSRLIDIACARSGDKGIHANIGVIARRADDFVRLRDELTPQRVADYLGIDDADRVDRFELPSLSALNFVVRGILDNPLRSDAQGKALGQVLLQMPFTREGEAR